MAAQETSRPSKRERTRLLIVETAVELLQDHDWDDLTVDGIAEEAGLVKTTLFNHFDGKADVLTAACLYVCDRMEDHIASGQPWDARTVFHLFGDLLEITKSHRRVARFLLSAAISRDQLDPLKPVVVRFEEIVERAVRIAYEPKLPKRDAEEVVSPAELAGLIAQGMLINVVHGLVNQVVLWALVDGYGASVAGRTTLFGSRYEPPGLTGKGTAGLT